MGQNNPFVFTVQISSPTQTRTGEHRPEQTDTGLAGSRQEEDSSEERSSDNHWNAGMDTGVLKTSSVQSHTSSWPGLQGGLIVVGVAAISSLVMYNLSGCGHGGSAGANGGATALAGDGPSLSAGSER